MKTFEEWVQENEADLNAGWQDEANQKRFQDMDEYLNHFYAAYVIKERRKRGVGLRLKEAV